MKFKELKERVESHPLGGPALFIASVVGVVGRVVSLLGGLFAAAVFVYPSLLLDTAERLRDPIYVYLTHCLPEKVAKEDETAASTNATSGEVDENSSDWVPDLAENPNWNLGVLEAGTEGLTFEGLRALDRGRYLVNKEQNAYPTSSVISVGDHVRGGDQFSLMEVTLEPCSGENADGISYEGMKKLLARGVLHKRDE